MVSFVVARTTHLLNLRGPSCAKPALEPACNAWDKVQRVGCGGESELRGLWLFVIERTIPYFWVEYKGWSVMASWAVLQDRQRLDNAILKHLEAM